MQTSSPLIRPALLVGLALLGGLLVDRLTSGPLHLSPSLGLTAPAPNTTATVPVKTVTAAPGSSAARLVDLMATQSGRGPFGCITDDGRTLLLRLDGSVVGAFDNPDFSSQADTVCAQNLHTRTFLFQTVTGDQNGLTIYRAVSHQPARPAVSGVAELSVTEDLGTVGGTPTRLSAGEKRSQRTRWLRGWAPKLRTDTVSDVMVPEQVLETAGLNGRVKATRGEAQGDYRNTLLCLLYRAGQVTAAYQSGCQDAVFPDQDRQDGAPQ